MTGLRRLVVGLAVPPAAFFAFVGYHKAASPLVDLQRFGAWTVWLPEGLGRAVGLSEILCGLALLAVAIPSWTRWAWFAAITLIANQGVAAAFHLSHGEGAALPQNAVIVAWLAVLALLVRRLMTLSITKESSS